MPVVKPGGGDNGQGLITADNEKINVDYTFVVPKGCVVKIVYEEK